MAIKPSLKGMANTGYLGRFTKDKFIQEGHNTSIDMSSGVREEEKRRLRRKRDPQSGVREAEKDRFTNVKFQLQNKPSRSGENLAEQERLQKLQEKFLRQRGTPR